MNNAAPCFFAFIVHFLTFLFNVAWRHFAPFTEASDGNQANFAGAERQRLRKPAIRKDRP